MRDHLPKGILLCGALVTLPSAVVAHTPLPGLEGVYVGLMHPLSTPDQALVLVATALLLGTFALPSLPLAFGTLILGLVGGLLMGPQGTVNSQWLFAWASFAAAWAALFPGRGLVALGGLTAVSGFGLGWASVPDAGPSLDRIVTMTGSFLGAALAIFYLSGAVEFFLERVQAPWLKLGLRVVAAWVSAVAIMMFAFETVRPVIAR